MIISDSFKLSKLEKTFTLFTILLTQFVAPSDAQKKDFEGIITYSQTFKSKSPEIADEQLTAYFGDTVMAYIKKGNYRQTYLNSTGITDVIYLSTDNKWYYKLFGIDTLFYIDCSVAGSEFKRLHKNINSDTILGYTCNQITILTKEMRSTFSYAKSLYINPSYFSQHKFAYYNLYAKETESIYLKNEMENEIYFSLMTACKIDNKKLEGDIFTLPKLPILKK